MSIFVSLSSERQARVTRVVGGMMEFAAVHGIDEILDLFFSPTFTGTYRVEINDGMVPRALLTLAGMYAALQKKDFLEALKMMAATLEAQEEEDKDAGKKTKSSASSASAASAASSKGRKHPFEFKQLAQAAAVQSRDEASAIMDEFLPSNGENKIWRTKITSLLREKNPDKNDKVLAMFDKAQKDALDWIALQRLARKPPLLEDAIETHLAHDQSSQRRDPSSAVATESTVDIRQDIAPSALRAAVGATAFDAIWREEHPEVAKFISEREEPHAVALESAVKAAREMCHVIPAGEASVEKAAVAPKKRSDGASAPEKAAKGGKTPTAAATKVSTHTETLATKTAAASSKGDSHPSKTKEDTKSSSSSMSKKPQTQPSKQSNAGTDGQKKTAVSAAAFGSLQELRIEEEDDDDEGDESERENRDLPMSVPLLNTQDVLEVQREANEHKKKLQQEKRRPEQAQKQATNEKKKRVTVASKRANDDDYDDENDHNDDDEPTQKPVQSHTKKSRSSRIAAAVDVMDEEDKVEENDDDDDDDDDAGESSEQEVVVIVQGRRVPYHHAASSTATHRIRQTTKRVVADKAPVSALKRVAASARSSSVSAVEAVVDSEGAVETEEDSDGHEEEVGKVRRHAPVAAKRRLEPKAISQPPPAKPSQLKKRVESFSPSSSSTGDDENEEKLQQQQQAKKSRFGAADDDEQMAKMLSALQNSKRNLKRKVHDPLAESLAAAPDLHEQSTALKQETAGDAAAKPTKTTKATPAATTKPAAAGQNGKGAASSSSAAMPQKRGASKAGKDSSEESSEGEKEEVAPRKRFATAFASHAAASAGGSAKKAPPSKVEKSVFARNETARTMEWSSDDESIAAPSGSGAAIAAVRKIQSLPEPIQSRGEHILPRHHRAASGRRIAWSDAEKDRLIEGVKNYGKKWSLIMQNYNFHSHRTTVDLKDKYRNLIKAGLVSED